MANKLDEIKRRWAGARKVDAGTHWAWATPVEHSIDDVAWLVGEVERLTRELAEQRDFAADCARADKEMGRELIRQRDEAKARVEYWKAKAELRRARAEGHVANECTYGEDAIRALRELERLGVKP